MGRLVPIFCLGLITHAMTARVWSDNEEYHETLVQMFTELRLKAFPDPGMRILAGLSKLA